MASTDLSLLTDEQLDQLTQQLITEIDERQRQDQHIQLVNETVVAVGAALADDEPVNTFFNPNSRLFHSFKQEQRDFALSLNPRRPDYDFRVANYYFELPTPNDIPADHPQQQRLLYADFNETRHLNDFKDRIINASHAPHIHYHTIQEWGSRLYGHPHPLEVDLDHEHTCCKQILTRPGPRGWLDTYREMDCPDCKRSFRELGMLMKSLHFLRKEHIHDTRRLHKLLNQDRKSVV